MIKIKSLFQRNYDGDRQVRDEIVPGSEWVINGEGYATRKWDGMAIKIDDGEFFKRYDAKKGRKPPQDFVPVQPEPDPETGHWPGWVSINGKEWVIIAIAAQAMMKGAKEYLDGTYEFCGPSVGTRHGANPENLKANILVPHGADVLEDCPRSFDDLKKYLIKNNIEGIVWYHPDGRFVKIKAMDFGIARNHVVKN